jgi:hypothetical protein
MVHPCSCVPRPYDGTVEPRCVALLLSAPTLPRGRQGAGWAGGFKKVAGMPKPAAMPRNQGRAWGQARDGGLPHPGCCTASKAKLFAAWGCATSPAATMLATRLAAGVALPAAPEAVVAAIVAAAGQSEPFVGGNGCGWGELPDHGAAAHQVGWVGESVACLVGESVACRRAAARGAMGPSRFGVSDG